MPVGDDAALLREAQTAWRAGDHAAAAAALAVVLTAQDPYTAPASWALVEAALLWTRLYLRGDDAPLAAVAWCGYAQDAAVKLGGLRHPIVLRAARLLAAVHTVRGEHADAYDSHSTVVAALSSTDLDGACRAGALADLAAHAAGRCTEAIAHLTAVWQAWQPCHDTADPAGLFYVYRLTAMLAACGRHDEARQRFRDAIPALPPAHTPQRFAERAEARLVLEQTCRGHDLVCRRQVGARYRRRPAPTGAVRAVTCAELLP
ncbi:hypothetical protein ABZS66_12145 [Dactylosporangium sp. NPDC005572]|uniref:hypothetical protein n=1 Tax=Dactylosporangium sp. NPDC005572 TaxID=3156889 RepID=UPI0033AF47D4